MNIVVQLASQLTAGQMVRAPGSALRDWLTLRVCSRWDVCKANQFD